MATIENPGPGYDPDDPQVKGAIAALLAVDEGRERIGQLIDVVVPHVDGQRCPQLSGTYDCRVCGAAERRAHRLNRVITGGQALFGGSAVTLGALSVVDAFAGQTGPAGVFALLVVPAGMVVGWLQRVRPQRPRKRV